MIGIVDQAVASATMVLLQLALARLLGPGDFGAFALSVGAAVAGLAVITALVLDPLSVRPMAGGGAVAVAAGLLGLLSLAVLPLVLVLDGVLDGGPLVRSLAVGMLAAPGLGVLWLARRVAYLRGRSGDALVASAVWAGLVLAGLWTLWGTGVLGPAAAAAVVSGAAGLAGAAAVARAVRWRWPRRLVWRLGLAHHLGFGGWLLAGLPFWVAAMQAPLWLLAGIAGAEAAGAFRVLHLLGMPLVQLSAAVGSVHQPRLAALAGTGDGPAVRRRAWRLGGVLALPAVPWAVALALGPDIVPALFGEAYAAVAPLAPAIIVVAGLKALTTGPNLVLRAGRRGRAVFSGTVAAGLVALGTALMLVPTFGLAGAIAAFGLGAGVNLLVLSVAVEAGRRGCPVAA